MLFCPINPETTTRLCLVSRPASLWAGPPRLISEFPIDDTYRFAAWRVRVSEQMRQSTQCYAGCRKRPSTSTRRRIGWSSLRATLAFNVSGQQQADQATNQVVVFAGHTCLQCVWTAAGSAHTIPLVEKELPRGTGSERLTGECTRVEPPVRTLTFQ